MRIMILGAGAIGGYYGARLIEAGADVTFAVRAARQGILARDGLVVHSALGDFRGAVRTSVAGAADARFDVVILACKGYDLAAAMDDIAPAVGPDTVVLPFLNGLGAYDRLDARFGRGRVLGGVAYIATQLDADGAIHHVGSGDTVLVGAREHGAADRARALAGLFQSSPGVRVLSADIAQALWDKWAMVAAGAALTCLMRADIGQLLATDGGARLAGRAILECEAVARAEGHPLSVEEQARIRALLLDPASAWQASMMRDIARGAARIEAEDIVGDLVRLARSHRHDTPLLDAAYSHLQAYAAGARG